MGGAVRKPYAKMISKNLAVPDNMFGGWLISKLLVKTNSSTEVMVARLCQIQPQHTVLEVGFGPGVGLKEAYCYVKDGPGTVYGIEISDRMMKLASDNLKNEITSGKVILGHHSVDNMPYDDGKFDRVFHTNCYYFWPDMDKAVRELHRVMKPDALMVTAFRTAVIKYAKDRNFMQLADTNPDRYMEALSRNGFIDVHMDVIKEEDKTYNAVFAKSKK